jgi:hypothetical protein
MARHNYSGMKEIFALSALQQSAETEDPTLSLINCRSENRRAQDVLSRSSPFGDLDVDVLETREYRIEDLSFRLRVCICA